MMRNLSLLAAVAAMLPAAALAQTVNIGQGRLDLVGQAQSACLTSAPTAATAVNATFAQTGQNAAEVRITQLVDPTTAQPIASSVDVAVPVICNTAHRLVIRSSNGGLLRQGVRQQAPGFRDALPYQVIATWAGQTANGGSASPVTINSPDGAAGQVSVSINVPGGGDPLVAGSYEDSIVIELQVAS
jgi:hypothetical protein